MKLTSNEQLIVMKRHFRAIGMSAADVMALIERANKGDKLAEQRVDAIASSYGSLRQVAESKKVANRSDKLGKSVLKSVTALTQWETYRAGAKHKGFLEVCADKPTAQKLFEANRRLTISEGIYLMSHHTSSALQAMTVNDIERHRLCDDESVKNAAVRFAKRFGLKV